MANEIDDLLTKLVQAYAIKEHKAKNYTDTYSRAFLLCCIKQSEDRIMYLMCAEDHEAMNKSWGGEDACENARIDKRAKEEIEWKDAQIKDIPWNRLIMRKGKS